MFDPVLSTSTVSQEPIASLCLHIFDLGVSVSNGRPSQNSTALNRHTSLIPQCSRFHWCTLSSKHSTIHTQTAQFERNQPSRVKSCQILQYWTSKSDAIAPSESKLWSFPQIRRLHQIPAHDILSQSNTQLPLTPLHASPEQTSVISSDPHYFQNSPRHLSPTCSLSPSLSVFVREGDCSLLLPSYRVRASKELILSCAPFALLVDGIFLTKFLCGRPLL